jgi:hypothetical protein
MTSFLAISNMPNIMRTRSLPERSRSSAKNASAASGVVSFIPRV